MDFRKEPKIKREELGIVFLTAEFFSSILVSNNRIFRPTHGLRDLIIHSIFFESHRNMLGALISSPDIPAYVALERIMGTYAEFSMGQTAYPLVALGFRAFDVEEIDTPEGQTGTWFGCREPEEEDGRSI